MFRPTSIYKDCAVEQLARGPKDRRVEDGSIAIQPGDNGHRTGGVFDIQALFIPCGYVGQFICR